MFKKYKHEKEKKYKKMLNEEDPFNPQILEADKERTLFFKMKKRLKYDVIEHKE